MFVNQQKITPTTQPIASVGAERTGNSIQIKDCRKLSVMQDRLIGVIQRQRKERAELVGLTVEQFIAHISAEQMDWADAFEDEGERKMIWRVITNSYLQKALKKYLVSAILEKKDSLIFLEFYAGRKANSSDTSETSIDLDMMISEGQKELSVREISRLKKEIKEENDLFPYINGDTEVCKWFITNVLNASIEMKNALRNIEVREVIAHKDRFQYVMIYVEARKELYNGCKTIKMPFKTDIAEIITCGEILKLLHDNLLVNDILEYVKKEMFNGLIRLGYERANKYMLPLLNYVELCKEGFIQSFTPTNDLLKAVSYGMTSLSLLVNFSKDVLKLILPFQVFEELSNNLGVLPKLTEYMQECTPVFETAEGEDVRNFIELCKEGWTLKDYLGKLRIRNYHRFFKSSLDKLLADLTNSGKPLTLILFSLEDHNGVFGRNEGIKETIENNKTRVFVIEGEIFDDFDHISFQKVAKIYGLKEKITQVLIVGHGNPVSIGMAPRKRPELQNVEGKDIMVEDKTGQISFHNKYYTKYWTNFFKELSGLMADKGDLKRKVVLFACSTNSLNLTPLRTALINLPSINSDTAQLLTMLANIIEKQPNVATHIQRVLKGIPVEAARAPITGYYVQFVSLLGQLLLHPTNDPASIESAGDYIERGMVFESVISAIVELWIKEGGSSCLTHVSNRLLSKCSDSEEKLIELACKLIMFKYGNNLAYIICYFEDLKVLRNIIGGIDDVKPSLLEKNVIRDNISDIVPYLETYGISDVAKLVCYLYWMSIDEQQQQPFLQQLSLMNYYMVSQYLEKKYWENCLSELFIFRTEPGLEKGLIILGKMAWREGVVCTKEIKDWFGSLVNVRGENPLAPVIADFELEDFCKYLGIPFSVSAPPVDTSTIPEVSEQSVSVLAPPVSFVQNIAAEGYHVEMGNLFYGKVSAKLVMSAPERNEVIKNGETEEEVRLVGDVYRKNDDETCSPIDWYMVYMEDGKIGYIKKSDFPES